MGYTVCGECRSLGQHQQGDIITVGLHTPECHQNPKYYNPPQSESEKFFAHLNNGEVVLREVLWSERSAPTSTEYRVVVIPKEVGE